MSLYAGGNVGMMTTTMRALGSAADGHAQNVDRTRYLEQRAR